MFAYTFIACCLLLWGYVIGRIHERIAWQKNFERELEKRLQLANQVADQLRKRQTDHDQSQEEDPS
jgi:hypothetical protein